MTLHPSKLALSLTLTTLLAWVLCSVAVALLPGPTMTIMGHLFHMPTDAFDWSLTWSGFAMGAICWAGFVFVFTFASAAAYNKLATAPST